MPVVSQEFSVSIGNDPAENQIASGDRAMYLDMLLSDYYGKMVRQGNSFCINGIQASLRPSPQSLGIDVGMSAEVGVDFVPTTKHSRAAWNNVYRGWRTQKKLDTAIGSQVRYDDLEFGWNKNEGVNRQRTSTIFGQGMSDNEAEKLVLIGASQSSSFPTVPVGSYSLEDYYNSAYETPAPSRNPFTNTDIKDPKWGNDPFPEVQTLRTAATSSAQWFEGGSGLNLHQGAITESNWATLPTDSHSLCGVLYVSAFIMPDDTAAQLEDTFILTVSVSVKSWTALIYKPKRKKGYRRKSKGYKSNYRSRRRYSKSRR